MNIFFNDYLVRIGLAEHVSYPPDITCDNSIRSAEEAQEKHLEMWVKTPASTSTIAPTSNALAPASPPDSGSGNGCHPSHPDICIPYPPPDLDCTDISYQF